MRKIAVVLFALAVMCVSGEPPAGKKSETVLLGSSSGERLEVYEEWDRGYFVYKQVNTKHNRWEAGGAGSDETAISITAVPIRTDWPASPSLGGPSKQPAEKQDGK